MTDRTVLIYKERNFYKGPEFRTEHKPYPVQAEWLKVRLIGDIPDGKNILNQMVAEAYSASVIKQLNFMDKQFSKWTDRLTTGPNLEWVKDVVGEKFLQQYAIIHPAGCFWHNLSKVEKRFFIDAYLSFESYEELMEHERQKKAFAALGFDIVVLNKSNKNLLKYPPILIPYL